MRKILNFTYPPMKEFQISHVQKNITFSPFVLEIGNWKLEIPRASRAGFTFIELILYVALTSMVVMAVVPFALNVILGSAKNSSHQEVYAQARVISERIKYEIRNATGINSVSSTSISLIVSDAAKNPTVIDLAAGKIRIKLGTAATVDLNSSTTNISSLTFTNYTPVGNITEHIGFIFIIDDTYTGTRTEYEVPAMTIESSAEVRSN